MRVTIAPLFRMLLAGLAVFALAPAASSCVKPKSDKGGSDVPAAVIAAGGSLRLPLTISTIDPAVSNLSFEDPRLWALARAVELPLVRARADGSVEAGLAASWAPNADATEWTFTMKSWAPAGEEQTGYLGQALKLAWGNILLGPDGPLKAQLSELVTGGREMAAGRSLELSGVSVDGDTLKISLTRPNQLFALWASQPGLGYHEKTSGASTGQSAVTVHGLGPFNIARLEGDELVLLPNPDSLAGKPLLDELRFVLIDDLDEQVARLRAGVLHSANVSLRQSADVDIQDDLAPMLIRNETAAVYAGVFDMHEFPWGDSKFQSKLGLRKSLNLSLERSQLQEHMGNAFEAWPHYLPAEFENYVDPAQLKTPPYPLTQMIEEARAEQIKADHEQGNKLLPGMDLGFLDGYDIDFLAVNILEYWNEISVKMQPFPMTAEEQALRIERGTHEIILRDLRPAYPSADALFYPFLHSALSGNGGNLGMLNDSSVDKLITDAQAASDDVLLTKLWRDLSRRIEDESLVVFIGYRTPKLLISQQVGGYALTPYDFDASLPMQDFAKLGLLEQAQAEPATEDAAAASES